MDFQDNKWVASYKDKWIVSVNESLKCPVFVQPRGDHRLFRDKCISLTAKQMETRIILRKTLILLSFVQFDVSTYNRGPQGNFQRFVVFKHSVKWVLLCPFGGVSGYLKRTKNVIKLHCDRRLDSLLSHTKRFSGIVCNRQPV